MFREVLLPQRNGIVRFFVSSKALTLNSSSQFYVADASANSRNDFLSYVLSLMRSHNSEHGDSLPVLDVSALKHVALIFDAIVFHIRLATDPSNLIDIRKFRGHCSSLGFSLEDDDLEEISLPLDVEQVPVQSSFLET